MKKHLLLSLLLVLAGTAQAQTYEKLPPKYYGTTLKTVSAFRTMTDTAKAAVHIPQADQVQVIGRVAPDWAVIKRMGFEYYMPARYVAGFSGDPAGDAKSLAAAVPKTEEYCVLNTGGNTKGFAIHVDYGQRQGIAQKEKDASGNNLNFNSAVDALNYMNSKGWEVVSVYTGTAYTALLIAYPATFYVMKRRIQQ